MGAEQATSAPDAGACVRRIAQHRCVPRSWRVPPMVCGGYAAFEDYVEAPAAGTKHFGAAFAPESAR